MKVCKVCNTSKDFPPHHKSMCRGCLREYNRQWCQRIDPNTGLTNRKASDLRHRLHERDRYVRYRHALRQQVLGHYGVNGNAQCVCCGESILDFLTIDHITPVGTGLGPHRRFTKTGEPRGGFPLYRWLKKAGFPDGFRTMCMNCNFGRALNGGICPHAAA